MTPPIGYYVHHHGDGHRQRALAIASGHPQRFVLLGTRLAGRTGGLYAIDLPDDRMPDNSAFDGIDGTMSRPNALHYAPLDHDGIRARMGAIARWITEHKPSLMVVDVSVEIAMLVRLCATPVAFVRLSGRRDDVAHCEAYRAASLVIAPFARQLDDRHLPQWVRNKTVYCPGIIGTSVRGDPIKGRVLVVAGKGGEPFDGNRLAAAAAATPDHGWRVIGPATQPDRCPGNLDIGGWVDDAPREIAAAHIVIGAAGDGLVNQVIAMAKPFVCLPEARPFDEQIQKAAGLAEAGAAIVLPRWPSAEQWPRLLADALQINPHRLARLGDPEGAAKTRALLEDFVDRQK